MDLCSLEELVTLQYGSFSALSDLAKQLTWRTRCSKQVTSWALRWQLYLDELGKDHPGWSVAQWQEWGMFLSNGSFTLYLPCKGESCNATYEGASTPTRPQQPRTWQWNCLYKACWVLQMKKSLKWPKMFTVDGIKWCQASSHANSKTSQWGTSTMSWANSYGGPVSAALQAQAGPILGAECAPGTLSELASHLEPSCCHQKPAGGKSPQHCRCSTAFPSWSLSAGPA